MEDQELVCVDCKEYFTFTVGEQEFYNGGNPDGSKLTPPKRCKSCRAKRRIARAQEQQY